ncbi:hypothetical protein [Aestuariibaculum marinum]|uniref:Uncharacterized protein n=1 Tax=Aestuariibaculum marinum TaxID=2683592 RepID=A0A8J6Q6F5_9FLAO|nr:hypothetical protein [Aestuariibaculum marinum]MBD0824433.1 hypothetical protein [Aestuariibaculum marinum]
MMYLELLQEQLALTYPESELKLSDNKLELFDVPYKGIRIEKAVELYVNFENYDTIAFEALATYFKPRLKFKDARFYYQEFNKTISIYTDKKFTKDKIGDFEMAMWYAKLIDHIVKEIKEKIEKVILD